MLRHTIQEIGEYITFENSSSFYVSANVKENTYHSVEYVHLT